MQEDVKMINLYHDHKELHIHIQYVLCVAQIKIEIFGKKKHRNFDFPSPFLSNFD